MKQYHDLLQDIIDNGVDQLNERTGIVCRTIPGTMSRYDLQQGFPAVTTKRLAYKSAFGELIGFLKGATSAKDFRELGCKVWDQNANENEAWLNNPFRKGEDDLGPVYGSQWRKWPAYKVLKLGEQNSPKATKLLAEGWKQDGFVDPDNGWGLTGVLYSKQVDQLGDCIRKIIINPSDRRILFHGWNPAVMDQIALPSCHLLYQFLPNIANKELNMTLYIRSQDMFLGQPFNIASASLLLSIVARLTGYTPRFVTIFTGDTHIYANHMEQVREQLTRQPYPLPRLMIGDSVPTFDYICQHVTVPDDEPWPARQETVKKLAAEKAIQYLAQINPNDFVLANYQHHPALIAPMAV